MLFDILQNYFFESTGNRPKNISCLCCGACCKEFSWHLTTEPADIARWKLENREDLLARVNHLGWIWYDPASGMRLECCPFLTKNDQDLHICGINDTKPAICRDYPTMAHDRLCIQGRLH